MKDEETIGINKEQCNFFGKNMILTKRWLLGENTNKKEILPMFPEGHERDTNVQRK